MQCMVWRFGPMKGYWIVRCRYNDQDAFEKYASLTTAVVEKKQWQISGQRWTTVSDGKWAF
ncbi:MAG: hypothetical protein Ct9H300mP4_09380 [Gammaproteobacteria bacterium]|nr:MAG: hypothetical protein Ct9H300mP4_09380 [Gammaproteobacteria bacterium]